MRKVQLVENPRSYAHDMPFLQSVNQQPALTEAERSLAQVTGGEFGWGGMMPWMMPWMWGGMMPWMMPWMMGGWGSMASMGYGMGGW